MTASAPIRTCAGCRKTAAKRALVRLVRGPAGVMVDEKQVRPGRGAYVHPVPRCLEAALSGGLARAWRRSLRAEELRGLRGFAETLSDRKGEAGGTAELGRESR